jgi:hypothetical protein
MRKSTKIMGALTVAGLAAAGSTAFTAASSIDDSATHVGAVTQSITGVTVSDVEYTTNGADETTAVAFHVTEDLVASDVVRATISATTPSASAAVVCVKTDPGVGTELTCTFGSPVANVDKLDIVVS